MATSAENTSHSSDFVKITRALISVSDKAHLIDFATALAEYKVELLSTGGTAKALRDSGLNVKDVSDHTGFPEMMDGRVKTLHPKIHGGLLAIRGKADHQKAMEDHNIPPIDLVISNLYPFENTVAKGADYETCVENIDIGGPSMVRSAAKNHRFVTIVTDPSQYAEVLKELKAHNGATTLSLRKKLAAAAFARTAAYDTAIAKWFATQTGTAGDPPHSHPSTAFTAPPTVTREYTRQFELKYGANPHENPAAIYSLKDHSLPLRVVNGKPGYINLLDACNAFQLVAELKLATKLPAATSFKHVSPAGAAVAIPLSKDLREIYEIGDKPLSDTAVAYVRARNADPMCSFGDFVALSEVVDEQTAAFLKAEVSDGIIAPGFTPKALEILKSKKEGTYIVLEADPNFQPTAMEMREVYGMGFYRRRNDYVIDKDGKFLSNVVTAKKDLPKEARTDLLIASITMKYTQSNSVGYAKEGQMIGIGAGQQSRVDCVKLAGRKVETWWLRSHPKVRALPFKSTVKKVERVNARVRYIEGDFTDAEYKVWCQLFESEPKPLSADEKVAHLKTLNGVSISSDAFFPFRDNIDQASKRGVQYVVQPGGSKADQEVIKAADEYSMVMAFTGVRLFHH